MPRSPQAGWLGIAMPEEYGGAGLGITEAAIMMQAVAESGAAMSGASAVHINIFGLQPVVVFGTDEQKRRMLPPLIAGKDKACFAVTEPDAGLDTTQLKVRAERRGDHYVLSGQKIWISTAQVANKMLILARTTPLDQVKRKTEGLTLFYTDLDRSRVAVRVIEKMGRHAVDSNEMFFDGMAVPAADRIGEEGEGFRSILHGMNPERILIAAEAVGIGRAALAARRQVCARARRLRPPDRPEPGHRRIRWRECWMELEAANLMVMKAARLYDRGRDCGAEANAAKYLAAEAGFRACETAVMTHGGMGYSQGIPRRALSARGHDPAHRAGHAAHDPQLHRREGARPAEVVLALRHTKSGCFPRYSGSPARRSASATLFRTLSARNIDRALNLEIVSCGSILRSSCTTAAASSTRPSLAETRREYAKRRSEA